MKKLLAFVVLVLLCAASVPAQEAVLAGSNAFAVTAASATHTFDGPVSSVTITNAGEKTIYGQLYYQGTATPPAATTSSPLKLEAGASFDISSTRGIRYVTLICGGTDTSTAIILGK